MADTNNTDRAQWKFNALYGDTEVRSVADDKLLAVVHAGPEQTRIVSLLKSAPQPNAALADGWLNPEDMAALQRVDGMFQDGEGYDVPAPQMKRLAALGVLRHHSAGRYSITTFGQVVLGVECFRKPLETVDECNARLGREHRSKLGIPAPPTLNASKEAGNG